MAMTNEEIEKQLKFLNAHRENLMRRVTELEMEVVELKEKEGEPKGAECRVCPHCSGNGNMGDSRGNVGCERCDGLGCIPVAIGSAPRYCERPCFYKIGGTIEVVAECDEVVGKHGRRCHTARWSICPYGQESPRLETYLKGQPNGR